MLYGNLAAFHKRCLFYSSYQCNDKMWNSLCLSLKIRSVRTHLQFTVLCGVMKWGPSPVVSDNLSAVQQQPAENLRVASTGCEVHGCRPVAIPVCKADLCETHLKTQVTAISVWSKNKAWTFESIKVQLGPEVFGQWHSFYLPLYTTRDLK